MANWTDLSSAFAYGTKLTSAQMQQLRDNITALSEGASGAPKIALAAMGSNSVDSAQYVDDSIDTAHYAAASVDQTAIGANAVGQSELKEASSSQEHDTGESNYTMTGGLYCFWPQVKVENLNNVGHWLSPANVYNETYATMIRIYRATPGSSTFVQWYYVTSSGEVHWFWVLVDKSTGKKLAIQQAPDHVSFGNRLVDHPFASYDPAKHEILCINPDLKDVLAINLKSAMEHDDINNKKPRGFIEIFKSDFEILESQETEYPLDRVTIGLPKIHNGELVNDWRFMPKRNPDGSPFKVTPIKQVIQKPDFITALKYKKKA
jgi:hypothetical protein